MIAIAAVDKNWGIGYKGNLLFSLPEDMRFFRAATLNKVVVMGRKTLLSFPGQKPLKDRINIVLSTDKSFNPEGVTVCRDFEGLFKELKKYTQDDIFVIGGGKVYESLLPFCDTALITKVDAARECDTYFPDLDKADRWKQTYKSETKTHGDLQFVFTTYKNSLAVPIK